MAAITFKGFRGAVPRSGERLLQARYAGSARNIKITKGNIVPLRGLQLAATTMADAIATIWRYRHVVNGVPEDNWLTFAADTDVVKTLVANDPDSRVFWSSDAHEPRMSIYSEAIDGAGPFPAGWWMLGVPSPMTAPTMTVDVATGTVATGAEANTPSAGKVTVGLNTVEGLAPGDTVVFAGVVGMTDLNTSLVVESISGLNVVFPLVTSQTYTSGGTWSRPGTVQTRSYAYTFVTSLGEESGPSPASTTRSGLLNGTWTLTNLQTAPANSGTAASWVTLPNGDIQATLNTAFGMQAGTTLEMTYDTAELAAPLVETVRLVSADQASGVVVFNRGGAYPAGTTPTLTWERTSPVNTTGMVKRIYRTEGSFSAFLFVAEIPVANTSYNDTTVTLTGEMIRTLTTLPPPGTLKCLVDLPNGCLCGLTDNEVCFSDPYMPYSWPVANRYSFVGRGVALCPVVNSVIVLTDGMPIMLTGSDPEAMSPTRIETYAPCVSKRGAVNVGGGVLYPSHDGLWLASAAGVVIKSRGLYRTDEWQALAPSTFDAEFHDGQYFAVHTPVGGKKQILVLDVSELDSAVSVDDTADALYRNDYDGKLYAAQGNQIFRWDSSDAKRYLSEWTSVEVQIDQPRNFGHAQVHANWRQVAPLDASILARNLALIAQGPDAVNGYVNGSEFNTFELNGSNLRRYDPPTERKVQFILLDENGPIFSRIVTSSRPFRLPAGFEQEVVRVGINASIEVYSATIAQSTEELSQAST